MLYIPWGCWHYCRSLTASISLNVWWNRDAEGLLKVPYFGAAIAAAAAAQHGVERSRLESHARRVALRALDICLGESCS